ncbi:nicotinamide/nicotinic acid mononucleotide adenylyltransferase 1-like [Styela clava]
MMTRGRCVADVKNIAKKRRIKSRHDRSKSREHISKRSRNTTNNTSVNDVEADKYSLIACGSFNPITNMHLRMFEVAKDYIKYTLNAEVSVGLVSPVSDGYKKQGLEISSHRNKMCSLAIKSNNWLEVSRWESNQKSWTPTIEVLRNAKNNLKVNNNLSKLMLLCGSDFFESFNRPGLWLAEDIKAIINEFGLLVIERPGYDSERIMADNTMLSELRDSIHIITDPINNDTSSTVVRRALRKKESIKYLTPDSVIDYIMKHKLYSTEESENKNASEVLAPYQDHAS